MFRFIADTVTVQAEQGTGERRIDAVAVPYNVFANASGKTVMFKPGSLPVDGKPPRVFMYHDATKPVGIVTERVDSPDGMLASMKISRTALGDEALTLAGDGVMNVSVGVNIIEATADEKGRLIVSKADWLELSLVPLSAFESAIITDVAAQAETEAPDETTEEPTVEETNNVDEKTEEVEAATIPTQLFAQPRASFKLPTPAEYMVKFARGGSEFAEFNANIRAAAPNVDTSETPGILPEIITGSVYDSLNPVRPFVSAIGVRAMPQNGATFRRPVITARPTVTQQPTGQLNTLDPSLVTVSNNDISKLTFGTYVTVSEQDLDWTDPNSLNIILEQLAIAYGQATDNYAVDAMVAATSQTETISTSLDDGDQWVAAIYGAAYQISNTSNYLPTHLFTSPLGWAKLAMAKDADNRPIFPFVGAPNLMGQNAAGNAAATTWNGNPLGLVLVVDKNMAGSTQQGGLMGVVGHAAGPAAGFEFYEQQKGAISIDVPSTLGRTIAFRGYAASFMADATKFVKLLAP